MAWPYAWFANPNYVQKSGRGTVTGRLAIKDSGDPNASAANIWVGLEQQPQSTSHATDFQLWCKAYQYWTKTDGDGKFKIPNVIAGTNYTLWAFGGAPGTFLSQNQEGGNPPLVCDLPERPFAVAVRPGETNDLGTVTWTPTRVGTTVFEIGYPDRKADKYRHGEDYWSPDKPPNLGYPTPVWGGQMEYPMDFPNGMTYAVGPGRWTTDWNYVLPSLPDATGAYQPCTGTITFNLASPPAEGSTASIYLGCAGDDGGHIVVSVNGTDLAAATGVVAAPNAFNATGAVGKKDRSNGVGGFSPPYSDDSSIHCNNHGPFSDERISFPGSLLHTGQNMLTVTMTAKSLTAYLMVDYLRLELTGYVPPAPSGVTASAGNGRALVRWTLVPGATVTTSCAPRPPAAPPFRSHLGSWARSAGAAPVL
jgi:rhamnogalacturonan endolyase